MSESNIYETLELEINQLKIQFSEFLPILQDFKKLKKNKRIPNDQASFSSLIMTAIKEDILSQVNYQHLSLSNQIDDLDISLKSNDKQTSSKLAILEDSISGLEQTVTQSNENISNLKGHVNIFYDKIDEIKKILDEKATNTDLNELKYKSKQFAYQSEVDIINQELYLKAPREAIDRFQKKITEFEDMIPSFVKKYQVDEIKSGVRVDIESYIDLNFITTDEFQRLKDITSSKHLKFEEDVKGLIFKIDNYNRVAKEALSRLSQKFEKKPWKKDVERVEKDLTKFAKITEMKDLERSLMPCLYKCEETVEHYGKKIDDYEQIIRRYDEILLEKSSKDDVRYLNKVIKTFVKSDDFEEFYESNLVTAKENKSQFQEITSQVSYIYNQVNTISSKLEVIKKENQEISHIASLLQSFREELVQKADKIDIHNIIDLMGRKSELDRIIEISEIFKKQLELSATLNLTLCRTLVQKEGPVAQQRNDVFRKMNNLVSWIIGSEPRVKSTLPGKVTPTIRQELYLSKDNSLKQLPRTARNGTARIKMRPTRYTPKLDFTSIDISNHLSSTIM